MKNIIIISFFLICSINMSFAQQKSGKEITPTSDRIFWLHQMDKMVRPVLQSLAHDSLRITMPKVASVDADNKEQRIKVQYVEVLGRVLSGIAPWLQLEAGDKMELNLRNQYRKWALEGLKNALDSNANDFMRFDVASQQLVDASFLSLAFLRAPWLWENLDKVSKERMVASIKMTRKFTPGFNNWLLFAAMNEAFLSRFGFEWDGMRVDYALRQLEQWYIGDGIYMDGTNFSFDYYNSYVIHPYLAGIAEVVGKKTNSYKVMFDKIKKRNQRYAIIQERLINTDGSYPPSGRSIIYRGGAFHHLADVALRKILPEELKPAQVRGALTAVIKKTLENPTTYKNGWLTIGLYGEQPGLGDYYNNQGSPYLATNIFLPLGLPATDAFWSDPEQPWSSKLIWSGAQEVKKDHSMDIR